MSHVAKIFLNLNSTSGNLGCFTLISECFKTVIHESLIIMKKNNNVLHIDPVQQMWETDIHYRRLVRESLFPDHHGGVRSPRDE